MILGFATVIASTADTNGPIVLVALRSGTGRATAVAFSPRRHSGLLELPVPHHRIGAGLAGGQVDAPPSTGIGSNLVAVSYDSASSATVPGAVPGKYPGCLGLVSETATAADFVLQAEVLPGLQSTARDPKGDVLWPHRACGITIGYGEGHSSGV